MSAAAADGGGARVAFVGLAFDPLTLDDAAAWIGRRSADSPFAYVVTPNVDHVVRLERMPDAPRRAYAEADLCLCDSRILARLAGLCGVALPVVPGSDLVPVVLERVLGPGDRLCVVGGSADTAAALRRRHPRLDIVHHAPPMGLLHDAAARRRVVDTVAEARPRITLLAVGSPQQELIAHEMRDDGRVRGTALCVGAAVEFVVGERSRAPRAVQRAGLEWAWRLASEPARLSRRYLVDGPAIFPIVLRWRRRQGRSR